MHNRIGRFTIPYITLYKKPQEAAEVFSKLSFVPLSVDDHSYSGNTVYTGLSPLFDVVPEGSVAPEYIITVTYCEDSSLAVAVELVPGTTEKHVFNISHLKL